MPRAAVAAAAAVLAAAPAARAAEGVLLYHEVADPAAVCVDGSRPYYYASASPGTKTKWQVIMFGPQNGFSWCSPPPEDEWDANGGNCYWGPMERTPAPNMTVPCAPGQPCLFSDDCAGNPTFCDYGRVWIQPCNSDGWMGDTDRTFDSGKVTLHFRGKKVLFATLAQLAKDLSLSATSEVVMVGYEGGANTLYQYADRVGDALASAAGVPAANYRVLPIEGFWPRWSGYFAGDTLAWLIGGQGAPLGPNSTSSAAAKYPGGNAFKYMNLSGAAHPDCLASMNNESDHWQCLLAANGLRYNVKSRIFPVEQVWGAVGSFMLVNDQIVNEPAWHGWHISSDPRDGQLHICVEYGWKCDSQYLDLFVKPYQKNILADIQGTGFLQRAGNGLFMHSCHVGDGDMLGAPSCAKITVGGRTAIQAVSQWMGEEAGAVSRFDVPCLWDETQHAVYQNNCNPTCPNIPYTETLAGAPFVGRAPGL